MNRKKLLVDKIGTLTSMEQNEIFKILKLHDVVYSQNTNGCFFNMSIVGEDALQQIEQFVQYCTDNKKHIEEYNKKLNECKMRGTLDVGADVRSLRPKDVGEVNEKTKKKAIKSKKSLRENQETAVVNEEEDAAVLSITQDDDLAAALLSSDNEDEEDGGEEDVGEDAVEPKEEGALPTPLLPETELRKKVTSRFVIARKKFAKRHVQDRRIEFSDSECIWDKMVEK